MLTFRLCNATDAKDWIRLNREFMEFELTDDAPWGDAAGVSDEEFADIFQGGLNSPELIKLLLIEEDGKAIGFANLLILYSVWAHGKALLMDDLYISDTCRGKGYGKKALEYVEEYGRELECKRLQFYSENSNPQAMGFYKAMGYEAGGLNVYIKYFND